MRTFKEQASIDRDIFFNLDEFGEPREIDGLEVYCVLEKDVYDEMSGSRERYGGIYEKLLTLFVKSEDLKQKPQISEKMMIDGERFEVIDLDDTSQLYEITLQRYDY